VTRIVFFTDDFAYVHQPKTGGTFVTSVFFRLYDVDWNLSFRIEHMLRREVARTHRYGTFTYHKNKHGTCTELPVAQREKLILATMRNPYELYVSQYEFGWWRRRNSLAHFRAVPDFSRRFPRFPNITFEEYVLLANAAFVPRREGISEDDAVGLWTKEFVRYYFREPKTVLESLQRPDRGITLKNEKMFNVRFILTHRLNEELYSFLNDAGYDSYDTAFVRDFEKVLPQGKGRRNDQSWERYYTAATKELVKRKEAHLLSMFPEFDV